MDKIQFWRLIEDGKERSAGDCEAQTELIEGALIKLPPAEIIAFNRILNDTLDEAYRWDLWGAGQLINGLCSDDGFFYFRAWLVAQGKSVYDNALANPDNLADVVELNIDEAECEAFLYVAGTAYEAITGQKMPRSSVYQPTPPGNYTAPEPARPKPDNDNAQAFYPHLWARDEVQYEGA